MINEISYLDAMSWTTARMADGGVFLTVGAQTPNTMTIGWGAIGYYWRVPVFTVVVRPQRHTHGILLREKLFTVSVPIEGAPMKAELAFAGTKSGADVNKFEGHGLTPIPAQQLSVPIIKECGLHFECAVKLVQDMDPNAMDDAVRQMAYPLGDMHTMFFGEIVRCYRTI